MEILPSHSKEAYSSSLEYFCYIDPDSDPNQTQLAIGDSYTYAGILDLIETYLVKLASTQHGQLNERHYQSLLNLRQQKDVIQNNFALNTFSPYINLFFDITDTAKENKYSDLEFLEALKKAMIQDDNLRKEVQQKYKAVNKNKNSLLRYIESLFEYRSRLLVLRIDFSYKKDAGGFFTTSDGQRIDLLFGVKNKDLLEKWSIEVREQRNQLIKQLKKKYKKDLVGYVWKLEYGADKAFHYHMIFFLDESHHRQDVKIAQSIGEMWKHEITKGKGIYWNCNAKKKQFEKNGCAATGKMKHDDQELRANLNHMALYLIKPDYLVTLALSDGSRTFGKGGKPKKIKTGRPRN
ncbi:MAG: inovirus-type Gp2 protein [Acinetobacter sp.]